MSFAVLIGLLVLVFGLSHAAYATVVDCSGSHCTSHSQSLHDDTIEQSATAFSLDNSDLHGPFVEDYNSCATHACPALVQLNTSFGIHASQFTLVTTNYSGQLHLSERVNTPDRPPNS